MEHLAEHGIERERIRLSQAGPFESYNGQSELPPDPRDSRVEIFVLSEMALAPRRPHESKANAAAPRQSPEHGTALNDTTGS
jgi:hypothetical protein